jgi:DNA-binding HxlR family transcriptional regulator
MSSYGQFCPIAKAMELLDERWTMLVVRELLLGSTRFNDLRRGVPRMSPALLSKRLRDLERAGLVERDDRGGYRPTESLRELRPVVEQLGLWGLKWIGELGEDDLDPHLLLWDMRRTIPLAAWPRTRTVLHLEFPDVRPQQRHWWLVVGGDDADVCDADPGYDVSATVRTDLATLTRLWRGEESWPAALRSGRVEVHGPRAVRRALPEWLGMSSLAQLAAAAI